MLDVLLILIALAAAATGGFGELARVGIGRKLGFGQGPAGRPASVQLATLLGTVIGRRRLALAAALARPAPLSSLPNMWPGLQNGAPPGGPPRWLISVRA